MKSILVVEDEKEMADILRQVLEESGYKVALAYHGPEGLNKLRNGEYDLVVLDVMLPGMDGFEVLKSARAEGILTPVLFLTAKDKVQDRVEGLDLGADDYVTKPFQLAELLARVRARVRRSDDTRMVMECEDLSIDIRTRQATRGKKHLYLSSTEFTFLELLMRNAGTPVSKAQILEHVWHDDPTRDDNVVEVYMNYLRNKIEHEDLPKLLHTVRGKGYMIQCAT
ncbi:MAG TPA: response regulator transcription factor [Fimbriimonadaceae bacterium]|jgi:two-component system copper resistance phosphate regulon response regulator CusR